MTTTETYTPDVLNGEVRDRILSDFAETGDRGQLNRRLTAAHDATDPDAAADVPRIVMIGSMLAAAEYMNGNHADAITGLSLILATCEEERVGVPVLVRNMLAISGAKGADQGSRFMRDFYRAQRDTVPALPDQGV